jgi:hypothetical protein
VKLCRGLSHIPKGMTLDDATSDGSYVTSSPIATTPVSPTTSASVSATAPVPILFSGSYRKARGGSTFMPFKCALESVFRLHATTSRAGEQRMGASTVIVADPIRGLNNG